MGKRQFFIQMPWKSELRKANSIPRSAGSEGRNMRPTARSWSFTITSTSSTRPEGRVRGVVAGAEAAATATRTSTAGANGRQ